MDRGKYVLARRKDGDAGSSWSLLDGATGRVLRPDIRELHGIGQGCLAVDGNILFAKTYAHRQYITEFKFVD